jgi:hypothetical protein
MNDSNEIASLMHTNLLEVFGQRDADLRRQAMARAYAADIAFTDPEGTVDGHDAVDGKVVELLNRAPETFVFAADGPLYVLGHSAAALPWTFGPSGGEPAARGIDVATIANGRITSLRTLLAA